ncbi:hypothetical protein THAOC_10624, partial [Thalassiosira oceanica]
MDRTPPFHTPESQPGPTPPTTGKKRTASQMGGDGDGDAP